MKCLDPRFVFNPSRPSLKPHGCFTALWRESLPQSPPCELGQREAVALIPSLFLFNRVRMETHKRDVRSSLSEVRQWLLRKGTAVDSFEFYGDFSRNPSGLEGKQMLTAALTQHNGTTLPVAAADAAQQWGRGALLILAWKGLLKKSNQAHIPIYFIGLDKRMHHPTRGMTGIVTLPDFLAPSRSLRQRPADSKLLSITHVSKAGMNLCMSQWNCLLSSSPLPGGKTQHKCKLSSEELYFYFLF